MEQEDINNSDIRLIFKDFGYSPYNKAKGEYGDFVTLIKGSWTLKFKLNCKAEVSLRLTNFVLHMYKQLTSEQRSQIFVLLQKKIKRKEIALLVGCTPKRLTDLPFDSISACCKCAGKRLSACEYGSTAVLGYPSTFLS